MQPMQIAFEREETLHAQSGAALHLYSTEAKNPRGIIQINHGLAEHAGRYARFANFLAENGYHVLAHDHRGHGKSSAFDAPSRRFAQKDGHKIVVSDVLDVVKLAKNRYPGLPIIMFGHSMGGLITLNFLAQHPHEVAASAIWNANFSSQIQAASAQLILAWERFRLGSDVPSRIMPRLTFRAWDRAIKSAGTSGTWLSQNRDEVAAYRADPLCGWDPTISLWQDVFTLTSTGRDDKTLSQIQRDKPINLVGGAEDPATENGGAVLELARRLTRLGFSNLSTTILPKTRHESLNEINYMQVMHSFLIWVDQALVSTSGRVASRNL